MKNLGIKTALKKTIHKYLGDILIPEDLSLLKDIRNGNAFVSYSQQSEDLAVQTFFKDKKDGFFVDIGAYHPVLYSNTYLFKKKGWKGINIEPNKINFQEFINLRKDDINLNCGVGAEITKMNYYEFNAPAMNTFSGKKMEEFCKNPFFFVRSISEINIVPLNKILDENLPKNQKIDFFNIDVEGFDLQVLKSNNWNKYRPTVILIEENLPKNTTYLDSEIYNFLVQLDYNLLNIINGTLMFIDSKVEN